MRKYSREELAEAIQQALDSGPRDLEDLVCYTAQELLGQAAADELTEEEAEALEADVLKVAGELGLDASTGEYLPPAPKKKARKPKAQAKKAQPKDSVRLCGCGCGAPVARRFKQGHDAKLLSMLKKVERGEMTKEELQERGVDLEAVGAVRGGVR